MQHAIFQGSSLQLVVHLADDTELVATVDNDDNPESLEVGSPIALTWDPAAPFVLEGRSAVIGATTTDLERGPGFTRRHGRRGRLEGNHRRSKG